MRLALHSVSEFCHVLLPWGPDFVYEESPFATSMGTDHDSGTTLVARIGLVGMSRRTITDAASPQMIDLAIEAHVVIGALHDASQERPGVIMGVTVTSVREELVDAELQERYLEGVPLEDWTLRVTDQVARQGSVLP